MALGINKITVKTITISAFTIYVGFYVWRIMFNNFAYEVFGAGPTDVGIIQAVREIPGLLAFGVGALALLMSESRISSFSIVLLGIGLILSGMSSSLWILGFATILMSFGFHYFEPATSSQLLSITKSKEAGKAQGNLNSFESLAGLVGAGMVLALTFVLDYRDIFYIIGGLVTVVGIYFMLALPSNRGVREKRKVAVKKKYWLYYTLAFLRGCRRHIFTTFAIFLLVKDHGLNIATITTIFVANNVVTFFTNRAIGSISDKFGEKFILVGFSMVLVFIFLGYAYVTYLPVLIAFYLIDNVMFGSSIALKSYIRKISTQEDLTGCLSFGMTANHITAIIIPVLGGAAWSLFGFKAPFIGGAVIVFIDMLFAFKVPSKAVLDKIPDQI